MPDQVYEEDDIPYTYTPDYGYLVPPAGLMQAPSTFKAPSTHSGSRHTILLDDPVIPSTQPTRMIGYEPPVQHPVGPALPAGSAVTFAPSHHNSYYSNHSTHHLPPPPPPPIAHPPVRHPSYDEYEEPRQLEVRNMTHEERSRLSPRTTHDDRRHDTRHKLHKEPTHYHPPKEDRHHYDPPHEDRGRLTVRNVPEESTHHHARPTTVDERRHHDARPTYEHTPRRRKTSYRDLDPRLESTAYFSRCTGRRKGLCIGINYVGQGHELKGCINDANGVRKALLKQFNYPEDNVMILWDTSPHACNLPTRENIITAMRWLVKDARPHDSLFFHYSGHGAQVKDPHFDELDGQDEVIFPMDHKRKGYITDDELHEIMVKNLPRGCRLTALFDSCHSGTVLDLPYIYYNFKVLKGGRMTRAVLKAKRTEGDVVSWCASRSDQKSVDTFIDGQAVGAMSHAFLKCLRDNPTQSYRGLLSSIRRQLTRYEQSPQLGCSHRIDTNRQFIM